ncbi:septum site-determining protein MinC [Metabacillus sp. FJAT-52054]|uniref:Probable septum site-determining protein MinC n=1 Tax=Metabacillus sediminis TaxID=3117746 RepID=A0ABZ2NDF8_9BACI
MKAQKQQYVTIKGTKDGLTLYLDDACTYETLILELEEMLSSKQYVQENGPLIGVSVKSGKRLLSEEQQQMVKTTIRKKKNLVVENIESDVVTKEEANRLKKEAEVVKAARIVRSGQVLQVEGDLLLIGDVNPGGTVIANGSIFVLGALRGTAHAGYNGNSRAIIAASVMAPAQLKIYDSLNQSPERIHVEEHGMECAYIDDEGQMKRDRLQNVMYVRPDVTTLEGGM